MKNSSCEVHRRGDEMDAAEGRLEVISRVSYEGPESLQDPERLQENMGCPSENLPLCQVNVVVAVDYMDITKGSLDDISRPASSERSQAGSRESFSEIRRASRDGHRSLEVLSPDVKDTTVQENTRGVGECAEHGSDEDSDEEDEDPELRKAIKKMKKLDRILARKLSAERQVKQKGRELHLRLWQELQAVRQSPESSDEMDNTRRFLALTPDSSQDCSEEVDFVPVFGTEVLEDSNPRWQKEENTCDVPEEGQQVMEDQSPDSRRHRVAHGKRRQDFVKKNIELAGVAGTSVLLTQHERERLEELLEDLEEDQNNTDSSSHTPKTVSSLCLVSGEGFTPEPSELDSLLYIDSRLQLLLPLKDFLSARSPPADFSSSPMRLLSLDEMKMGDRGERVLLDVRETREQDSRLREIKQQLQVLEETDLIHLSDDQLKNLLLKCEEEMVQSSSDLSSGLISALDSRNTSPLVFSPPPSSSNLSDLLPGAETDNQIPSD
ncbi:fibrous sheath-interacting protein 1 isoform X2 [Triplophysa dalaica]|uniref:fibrous sheath-interacting protein 1 isoform X2 n=1 Tax=Triplophysa dalaica TaxID=1582913 RepID=UPI0024DF4313|nr:fibrous sheath-interacting protein 1 isoform X2 [Triplophysa dalaica]